MLWIKKQQPPSSFLQFIKNQNPQNFAELPATVKSNLKSSLLVEQHYACAYCMQKITADNMKVEHFLPQSQYPNQVFDYQNLFAVCKGTEYGNHTCDTSKGSQLITVNPLNEQHIQTLCYGLNGSIKSSHSMYCADIQLVLNLNEAQLLAKRKNIRMATIKKYQQIQKSPQLSRKIANIKSDLLSETNYESYLGIKLATLDKILAKK